MNLNDKQNRTESPDVPAEMAEVTAVDVVSPVRADAAEESVEEIGARTLSPGRLVMKRFFRSRLSMTGLIVLLVLFVFSFAGPLMKFLPFVWGEKQADESQQIEQAYYTEVESPAGDGSKVWIVHYSHPTNYLSPSGTHLLGTDDKGFDVFSRLMYGGRVSLTVGFVVIILETVLGVFLGGLAGCFGKWVDQVIMRIVDIFYCIPSTPLIIILGAAMDGMRVDPQVRMLYLMLILGFLGWPGIARLVRGQILSLREQEFMTATEACGISVSRRIFRHLIPNVIPQLIVNCTMSLGSTIITEATLSFLGLGVKFPFASWGNIMNDVSNSYVLTEYWFIWIPAGICLLITVLGFNFVGDGLRDAFDPKMKR